MNGNALPQPLYPTMAPGTRLPDMCPGTEPDAGLPATGSEFQTALASINRKRQSNLAGIRKPARISNERVGFISQTTNLHTER